MHKMLPAIIAAALMAVPTLAVADAAQTAPPVVQPAAAPPPVVAQPAQPAQTAAADPAKKPICKMMAHDGMLVKTTICHTQQEWDDIRLRQERGLADFQNRNYQTSSGK